MKVTVRLLRALISIFSFSCCLFLQFSMSDHPQILRNTPFLILLTLSLLNPLYSFGIGSLKGSKISSINLTKDDICDSLSISTRSLEHLIVKQLSDYGIYDTSNVTPKAKCFSIGISCLCIDNSYFKVFMIEFLVKDVKIKLDLSPDVVYYKEIDYGYTPDNKLDDIIETSIKRETKKLIDFWVICNSTKK